MAQLATLVLALEEARPDVKSVEKAMFEEYGFNREQAAVLAKICTFSYLHEDSSLSRADGNIDPRHLAPVQLSTMAIMNGSPAGLNTIMYITSYKGKKRYVYGIGPSSFIDSHLVELMRVIKSGNTELSQSILRSLFNEKNRDIFSGWMFPKENLILFADKKMWKDYCAFFGLKSS